MQLIYNFKLQMYVFFEKNVVRFFYDPTASITSIPIVIELQFVLYQQPYRILTAAAVFEVPKLSRYL